MSPAKPQTSKKDSKHGGYYTPYHKRGEVQTLHFLGFTQEEIAERTNLGVTTVSKIILDPETKELQEKQVTEVQRRIVRSSLLNKALIAVAKVIDKEIAEGRDTRAREILNRFGVFPPIPVATGAESPSVTVNLQNNSLAVGTSEGQKKMIERMAGHVAELQTNFAPVPGVPADVV